MTPEQLREIEVRWAKATPGPWVADMRPVATECSECGEYAYEVPGVIRRKSDGCGIVDVQDSEKQNENATAIAAAPTDITLLLAEVKRLRCCGNCEHFETVCGEGKCFVECEKPAWRFDKEVKYAEGNGKCDKWEAADNG